VTRNGAERAVRTARSECLDWLLILNQPHLSGVSGCQTSGDAEPIGGSAICDQWRTTSALPASRPPGGDCVDRVGWSRLGSLHADPWRLRPWDSLLTALWPLPFGLYLTAAPKLPLSMAWDFLLGLTLWRANRTTRFAQ